MEINFAFAGSILFAEAFFRNWVIGNNAPRIFINIVFDKAPRASKAGQMKSYQPKMPVFHQRDFWQVRPLPNKTSVSF